MSALTSRCRHFLVARTGRGPAWRTRPSDEMPAPIASMPAFCSCPDEHNEIMSALERAMPTIGSPLGTGQLDMDRLRNAGLGVYFRPHQVDELGITYDQLRRLVSTGVVEHVARGLYRLADEEPTEHETIAAVCARVPNPSSACSRHSGSTRSGLSFRTRSGSRSPTRPGRRGCDSAPDWFGSVAPRGATACTTRISTAFRRV